MNEISIGAVGAAAIAGLVSLLGLIIGKEQKVSEFRQVWIDDLRKCLIAYLVNINAIVDALMLKNASKPIDEAAFVASYKALNEASHGIAFRINAAELPAQKLLTSMSEFEALSKNNATLTPANILLVEEKFIASAKELLKYEWRRVKRGESTFVLTRRIVTAMIAIMLIILAYAWFNNDRGVENRGNVAPEFKLVQVS